MALSLVGYIAVAEFVRFLEPSFQGVMPEAPLGTLRPAFLGVSALLALGIPWLQRRALLGGLAGQGDPAGPLVASAIAAYALCELPAILGLVLFLLGGERMDMYGFAAISAALFYLHFPRCERWQAWQRR